MNLEMKVRYFCIKLHKNPDSAHTHTALPRARLEGKQKKVREKTQERGKKLEEIENRY